MATTNKDYIACLDVDYRAAGACAACVLLEDWPVQQPIHEFAVMIQEVAEYQPGEFYRRELPCLLAALDKIPTRLACVVIDGYVWLNPQRRPGLGAYLYDAMGQATPVIGVAKTAFQGANFATLVSRGNSQRPLYVTSVGIAAADAAACILRMHGEFRFPTLLKRVDRLCRTA